MRSGEADLKKRLAQEDRKTQWRPSGVLQHESFAFRGRLSFTGSTYLGGMKAHIWVVATGCTLSETKPGKPSGMHFG